jgi:hypothetical protein
MAGLVPSPIDPVATSPPQLESKNINMSGWNGGVQTGLRTSFAAKSRTTSVKPDPSIKSAWHSNLLSKMPQGSAQVQHPEEDDSNEEDLEDSMNNSSDLGNGSIPKTHGMEFNSTPFVSLSKEQRANLSLAERQAYNAARKLHKKDWKLQTLHDHTAQAQKTLSQEKRWPISHGAISDMINKGKTFYARNVDKPLTYTNGSRTFNLAPIWDEEGKPIKLQEFSFNRFAPAFIKQNLDKASALDMDDLHSAFHAYCKKGFYRHLWAKCQPLMDTVNADDALTLEQAMKLGGLPDHRSAMRLDNGTTPQAHIALSGGDQTSRHSRGEGGSSMANAFVFLSSKDKKKLPPSELAAYEGKLEEHHRLEKEAVVRSATLEADRIIKLVGRWPLPEQYKYATSLSILFPYLDIFGSFQVFLMSREL